MNILIDVDEDTQKQLEHDAGVAGKPLHEYVAELVKFSSVYSSREGKSPRRPNLGFAAGRGVWISDDFNAPLDEFKDYM